MSHDPSLPADFDPIAMWVDELKPVWDTWDMDDEVESSDSLEELIDNIE